MVSVKNYNKVNRQPLRFRNRPLASLYEVESTDKRMYTQGRIRGKHPPITPEEAERAVREFEERKKRDSLQRDSIRQDAGQPSEDRTSRGKKKHKNKTT